VEGEEDLRLYHGFPAAGPTLCNWNQHFKLDPEFFGVWARIIKQVPNSTLIMLRYPEVFFPLFAPFPPPYVVLFLGVVCAQIMKEASNRTQLVMRYLDILFPSFLFLFLGSVWAQIMEQISISTLIILRIYA